MPDLPWEDNLLERKTESDLRDLPKTLVAFANSVKPGHTAVILIGEMNDGTAQGVTDPDKIQKTIRADAERIYPPILWKSFVYEKDGKPCMRVEIEYDGETPHFGDAAWIRRGSVTEKASDEVFQHLVEFRLSKVRQLAKWIGEGITVSPDLEMPLGMPSTYPTRTLIHPRWVSPETVRLLSVNSFWVTFQQGDGRRASEPLEKIVLSWDDENDRLRVLVKV
jgi:hypothetical protein